MLFVRHLLICCVIACVIYYTSYLPFMMRGLIALYCSRFYISLFLARHLILALISILFLYIMSVVTYYCLLLRYFFNSCNSLLFAFLISVFFLLLENTYALLSTCNCNVALCSKGILFSGLKIVQSVSYPISLNLSPLPFNLPIS